MHVRLPLPSPSSPRSLSVQGDNFPSNYVTYDVLQRLQDDEDDHYNHHDMHWIGRANKTGPIGEPQSIIKYADVCIGCVG